MSKVVRLSFAMLLFMGCAHRPVRPTPALAPRVELSRFMGDWYIIASIPVWFENTSHDGVETYRLDPKGRIQTTYTFRKGGFSGPLKTYRPVGTVYNRVTNSEWRMQFIWPFKAVYLIHYVDDAYTTTLVGEPSLKHLWIMARTPQISEDIYKSLVARVSALGYDASKLRRVPQRWESVPKE